MANYFIDFEVKIGEPKPNYSPIPYEIEIFSMGAVTDSKNNILEAKEIYIKKKDYETDKVFLKSVTNALYNFLFFDNNPIIWGLWSNNNRYWNSPSWFALKTITTDNFIGSKRIFCLNQYAKNLEQVLVPPTKTDDTDENMVSLANARTLRSYWEKLMEIEASTK